jgi:Lrp/AsnC family transcriptional regulator for asnA, asnC and gidA
MTSHSTTQLNDLDMKLIQELETNARQTAVELAKKLRIDRHSVRAKLQRLLDDRIIRIMPIVDPLALGHLTRVSLAINTLPSEVDTVANAFASHKRVHHVAIYTGRYNLLVWAVLENPEDLTDFVMRDLPYIDAITRVETSVNLQILKLSYAYLSVQNHALLRQPPAKALGAIDLKLLEELRNDALQTLPELAQKLQSNPSTVRRKLQRLLDERIVRVVAIADPPALGYNTWAVIGIVVQPGKVDEVGRKLATFQNINHVAVNTGNFDLMVSVVLKGQEELSKFVREDLGNIQGLVSYETMVCLKTVKEHFNWP